MTTVRLSRVYIRETEVGRNAQFPLYKRTPQFRKYRNYRRYLSVGQVNFDNIRSIHHVVRDRLGELLALESTFGR